MPHTPGPWKAAPGEVDTMDGRLCICLMTEDDGGQTSADDARLIAAAPELLEALQCIVNDADRGIYLGPALNIARAAIAKVTEEV